jgi:hypothetical protein
MITLGILLIGGGLALMVMGIALAIYLMMGDEE